MGNKGLTGIKNSREAQCAIEEQTRELSICDKIHEEHRDVSAGLRKCFEQSCTHQGVSHKASSDESNKKLNKEPNSTDDDQMEISSHTSELTELPELRSIPYVGNVSKEYLHPLKIWHFLDSKRVSNITGATITKDRRVVFADNANGSLKAYGLKVSKHFWLIRRRECRRSYIHLVVNVGGGEKRYFPFDLCEYDANKLAVTTGDTKMLLFVDLGEKKINRIKHMDHAYYGIIFYEDNLITVSKYTKVVSFLDCNGNEIQNISLKLLLSEPQYLSYISRNNTLIVSEKGTGRLLFIKFASPVAARDCIFQDSLEIELFTYEWPNMFESPGSVSSESRFVKPVLFVCGNKEIRRLQHSAEKGYEELSPIKVGKMIQYMIYDDVFDEMYICPKKSHHALIWNGGGNTREVKMNRPLQVRFSSPDRSPLKPELKELEGCSDVELAKVRISFLSITTERKIVLGDFHNCRLLVNDLNLEVCSETSAEQSRWLHMRLKIRNRVKTISYKPSDLCQYETNKVAVTTRYQRTLHYIDLEKKQIDKSSNTTGIYDRIIYYRNTFIVTDIFDKVLCFLNMNGEELQRMTIPGIGSIFNLSRLDDTLLMSDYRNGTVWSIPHHDERTYCIYPDSSRFSSLWGITTDDRGILNVCERNFEVIRRFDLATHEELPSFQVGYRAEHIAFDRKTGRLYFTDSKNKIIWFQTSSLSNYR